MMGGSTVARRCTVVLLAAHSIGQHFSVGSRRYVSARGSFEVC